MSFASLRSGQSLVKALAAMVDTGHIPHAMLFHEEDGGGAFPLCLAFLEYVYCSSRAGADSCGACSSCSRIPRLMHPDVHIVVPTAAGQLSSAYIAQIRELVASNASFTEAELQSALKIEGKNSVIAVAEAKRLLDELSLTALEGGYRSVIIYLPEKMNAEAANKLLKMIEEPPAKTLFLLITHRPEKLLTTISSRCQRIRVAPNSMQEREPAFEQPELFYELMRALCLRRLGDCLDAADKIAALPSRESAKAFCLFASANLRQIFLAQQGIQPGSEHIAAWAKSCPKSFPRKALAVLDRGLYMIERNVNLKVLFTDIADKLYTLL